MTENTKYNPDDFDTLIKALCGWYVRRDRAFYAVKRLDRKLSREDVKRTALLRFGEEFPTI